MNLGDNARHYKNPEIRVPLRHSGETHAPRPL